jgi:hypothetical protein
MELVSYLEFLMMDKLQKPSDSELLRSEASGAFEPLLMNK